MPMHSSRANAKRQTPNSERRTLLHRQLSREIQHAVIAGAVAVAFLENRQFRNRAEKSDRVGSVGNGAAEDIFTGSDGQHWQLKPQREFAGLGSAELSRMDAENKPLDIGQRYGNPAVGHGGNQFDFEVKGNA